MASLCHPWFTTTSLSYRFPIFETSATALCGTTGNLWVSLSWELRETLKQSTKFPLTCLSSPGLLFFNARFSSCLGAKKAMFSKITSARREPCCRLSPHGCVIDLGLFRMQDFFYPLLHGFKPPRMCSDKFQAGNVAEQAQLGWEEANVQTLSPLVPFMFSEAIPKFPRRRTARQVRDSESWKRVRDTTPGLHKSYPPVI